MILVSLVHLVLLGLPLASSRAPLGDRGISPGQRKSGTRWGRRVSNPQDKEGFWAGLLLEAGYLSVGLGSFWPYEEGEHFFQMIILGGRKLEETWFC